MLLFSRSFSKDKILCSSEHEFVADHFAYLLNELGVSRDKIIRGKSTREYSVSVRDRDTIDRIFADFGYTGDEPSVRLSDENFSCAGCAAAFVSGAFLVCGSVTRPSSGYHLEFTSHKKNLCDDFVALLESGDFAPKRTARGYLKILYFKNSTSIEDILTYIGAMNSSLELMNEKIYKDIVNSVNRRTNCESANIDKMVNSAMRDIECIKKLNECGDSRVLGDELRELARLRVENPELSMLELGALTEPPLTKSGVSHRLRKIRKIAEMAEEA